MVRREKKAKAKYFEFNNADYGHPFSVWLGVEMPEYEYRWNCELRQTECRMYRSGRFGATITGDWGLTKKAAKASYKAALKAYNDKMRKVRLSRGANIVTPNSHLDE